MPTTVTRTFQLRLSGHQPALEEMADVYQQMVRQLYAEARKTDTPVDRFNTDFCARYGVPARLFNAAATDVKGKIASVRETARNDAADLRDKLAGTEQEVRRLRAKRARDGLTRKQKGRLGRQAAPAGSAADAPAARRGHGGAGIPAAVLRRAQAAQGAARAPGAGIARPRCGTMSGASAGARPAVASCWSSAPARRSPATRPAN